ncbi:hypothetical protein GLOIN_2v1782566 [Rhizophagus clarus]|uniref:Uncharacterized protein n=1 Tax=Rhizophagus clarus TaxID=94130 RepID=A0A8H3L287_9GLOM|nr:hypothetical protein GLOIN_2v1782566 [Rhizophagus clarus]
MVGTIRQEGLYPQLSILEKKRTVKCFINYIEERPIFRIIYGINFSEEVQSNISSTTAANAVLRRKFRHQLKQHVESKAIKVYGNDKVTLKKISYSVRDMDFQINYEEKNDIKEKKLISVAKAIDFNYIPRKGYRALTSVEQDLQREWAVSKQRLKITTEMNQKISITLIDLPSDLLNIQILNHLK